MAVERANDGNFAVELQKNQRIRQFTSDEMDAIGNEKYVFLQSGYDRGNKTITLTFDDGPDEEVTRQLLDVLSAAHVQAAFFVQGKFVAEHPDIVQRMVCEGHEVGGHSVHHPYFPSLPRWRQHYEIATTEHLIREATGTDADIWRMPFDNGSDSAKKVRIGSQLLGQQMGYQHIGYDFDTTDWEIDAKQGSTPADIPLPSFDGKPMTVLMHDAGGPNREKTVAYVRDYLIPQARANGYTFANLEQANSELAGINSPVAVTWVDKAASVIIRALHTWPTHIMGWVLIVTVILTFTIGGINVVLATQRYRAQRKKGYADPLSLPIVPVTVLLAAYNEEKVIERTIRNVLKSEYPLIEVLIIDDGSKDNTAEIVRRLAAEDSRVRLVQQANGGKSVALNHGLTITRGTVVVTIDADTIVAPDTVGNLVRHFAADEDGKLAAVAGVVRVGNTAENILTRWQALEYVTQIGVSRGAQARIGGISIVPGACSAWRREALQAAGGYSSDTLAEDTDLTLSMHELGWRVEQDDQAYAFTEAPNSLDDLLKQRVRWTYGTMQAMWKHRGLLFNREHPALGFFVMPDYLISLAFPLALLPFTLIMTFVALQGGGPMLLFASFMLFFVYQMVLSGLAVKLLDEDWRHLLTVPLYRLIFEPMRVYLLYATVLAAIKGVRVRWNRVVRTGTVSSALDAPPTSTTVPELEKAGARRREEFVTAGAAK